MERFYKVGNFTLECRADLFKDNHRRLSWTTALHRRMPGSPWNRPAALSGAFWDRQEFLRFLFCLY